MFLQWHVWPIGCFVSCPPTQSCATFHTLLSPRDIALDQQSSPFPLVTAWVRDERLHVSSRNWRGIWRCLSWSGIPGMRVWNLRDCLGPCLASWCPLTNGHHCENTRIRRQLGLWAGHFHPLRGPAICCSSHDDRHNDTCSGLHGLMRSVQGGIVEIEGRGHWCRPCSSGKAMLRSNHQWSLRPLGKNPRK